ncbi:DUF523 domain-containing protein [Anaeromyxobacter oryzisoli]|uniref:DUF523 domain-containing protein n=1 Tax=Anaeromyxobacter oryzisoli TaxID=2925408 RepID=UPI001F59BAFB|nr:DUF523 domain-containing protein [Anaeromyxobacter sp. SG63]
MTTPRPRVGVSACLLGAKVRYDGGDRRDAIVVEALGRLFEWVPVCPEVEVGMAVPREPIRLVGSPGAPRLVGERSGRDHTVAMRAYAERRVAALAAEGLAGYVTKASSPSCGLEGVRVWPDAGGPPRLEGVGAFVAELRARLPLLPVEEEGRLADPAVRARFVERILAYDRRRRAAAVAGPG